MATAQDVLRIAAGEVGYREGAYNWTKYSAEMYGGKYQNQAWCGVFTDWCFSKVNMLQGEPSSVWTPAGAQGYQVAGRWVSRSGSPQAGDVVYFDWGGSQTASLTDHVGLVEAVTTDYILTIEGNTSSSNAGSQNISVPRPSQASQAPMCELNEKCFGESSPTMKSDRTSGARSSAPIRAA